MSLVGNTGGTNQVLPGAITLDDNPVTLSANTDDFDPAGGRQLSQFTLSAAITLNLTGIAGGIRNRTLRVINISTNAITLKNNTTSLAGNRFLFGSDLTLSQYDTVDIAWSQEANGWILTAGSAGSNPSAHVGRLLSLQILTGTGVYTPTPGTQQIYVTAVGGGGGGGQATGSVLSNAAAGGGAGGSFCSKFIKPVAASYNYTAGVGGAASSGAGGVAGGTTTFDVILTAPGGTGGADKITADATPLAGTTVAPGGGVATGGDVNSDGRPATANLSGLKTVISAANPATGGSSPYGAGGRGATVGAAGSGFGAGGGGAVATTATVRTGGAGAPGVVFVWEYS